MDRMILHPPAATAGPVLPPAHGHSVVAGIIRAYLWVFASGAFGIGRVKSGSKDEAGGGPTAAPKPPGDRAMPTPWVRTVARIALADGPAGP